jgi:hypothetical protein
MSDEVNCWRCDRTNNVAVSNCEGCGVENPSIRPNSTARRVVGSSASEAAWEKYAKRDAPNLATSSYDRGDYLSRTVASRLEKESGLAITYIRITGIASIVVIVILFLVTVPFSYEDAGVKFLSFLMTLGIVLGISVSVILIVPFYTYMNLRARDFQNR